MFFLRKTGERERKKMCKIPHERRASVWTSVRLPSSAPRRAPKEEPHRNIHSVKSSDMCRSHAHTHQPAKRAYKRLAGEKRLRSWRRSLLRPPQKKKKGGVEGEWLIPSCLGGSVNTTGYWKSVKRRSWAGRQLAALTSRSARRGQHKC